MRSVIVVHPKFDRVWPWTADHFHEIWKSQGPVEFYRLEPDDESHVGQVIPNPENVTRLIVLVVPVTVDCLRAMSSLQEVFIAPHTSRMKLPSEIESYLEQQSVRIYTHANEGFWGQSVAEFALGLTICGLRRIPQVHHEMITSHEPWNHDPEGGIGRPASKGRQFSDDKNFVNGTIYGKRVRIIGAGNIASRYASFVHMLGADVAAWDPFASEPSFHRAGTRRELHLDRLLQDADIFVPMVPLTEGTNDLIHEKHIRSLPKGCLVVLVTRAKICNMPALRERVLLDELCLAADVFDTEPLPLDDPLLGRHNVVHTPHNAGRTLQANQQWAERIAEQFIPTL